MAVRMHSAEHCRRRGLVAKQRAAHATDLSLKEAFKDVARHWLALAERVDWLDRQHNGSKPIRADDTQPGRLPTVRSEVPRSGAQSINGKKAGRPAGQSGNL
jgi:hypothetical protein